MPGQDHADRLGRNSRITWIWPGDVCVRSSTPGVVVWNVSHMSRAGWCGGMFEQLEVGLVVLDLAAAVDLEAHVGEDGVDLAHDLAWPRAAARGGPGGPAASRRVGSADRLARRRLLLDRSVLAVLGRGSDCLTWFTFLP